jgi:hypothetical protein
MKPAHFIAVSAFGIVGGSVALGLIRGSVGANGDRGAVKP